MRLQRPNHVRPALPYQLVLKILDSADLLYQPLLRLNLIEVHDNLAVQFQQAMIRFRERVLYTCYRLLQMGFHPRTEKHLLTYVKELFRFFNQQGDICPFPVQILESLALDGIIALIFVRAVDGPLEIDDIAVGRQCDATKYPQDFPHITMPPGVRSYREPEFDVFVQGIDVLFDGEDVDLLIHFQHLLEKAQVGILQDQEAVRFSDDPMFKKVFQPAGILG